MTFDFSKAITYLKQGKKVRISCWENNMYIFIDTKCGKCYLSQTNGSNFPISVVDCITNDNWKWELYDESVEVGTLKEGDLFSFTGLHGKQWRLLPAYMMDYVGKVRNVPSDNIMLPCIAHAGFDKPDLCYVASDLKVIKES